jgi:hypothetical protein
MVDSSPLPYLVQPGPNINYNGDVLQRDTLHVRRTRETRMRKWLFVLLVLAVLYALSTLTGKKHKARYPILRRIDRAITVVVWVLLAAYGIAFFYWLFGRFIGRQ